ncbi:hypothetical protein CYMTET_34409, partial [Cymbomonas tetramitiformis]
MGGTRSVVGASKDSIPWPSIMEGPSDASARQTGEPPAGGPAIGGRQSSRSAADGFWWKAPVGSSPASRGPPSARSSQLGVRDQWMRTVAIGGRHADAVNGWERAPARELALNSLSPGYVASSSAGAYSEMDGTDWVMEVEQRLSNSQFSLPSSTAAAGCGVPRPGLVMKRQVWCTPGRAAEEGGGAVVRSLPVAGRGCHVLPITPQRVGVVCHLSRAAEEG